MGNFNRTQGCGCLNAVIFEAGIRLLFRAKTIKYKLNQQAKIDFYLNILIVNKLNYITEKCY